MIKRVLGRVNLSWTIIRGVKNWPHVFLNYFNLSKSPYILFQMRRGSRFKVRKPQDKRDTSGIATVFEIFLMKNYTPKGMPIYDSDIIIDIGANMGIFSIYAALKAKKGKVYAYEPFKTHHNRLEDNIKMNNLTNVKSFQLGIAGKKGKKELFLNDNSSGMHSIVFQRASKNKIMIDCITLEDIFKKNKIEKCDFLKMDCEGAEYDIVFNTNSSTFKKIKLIALEFDNIDKERNCFQLKKILEKNNFEVLIKGAYQHQGILYARNLGLRKN